MTHPLAIAAAAGLVVGLVGLVAAIRALVRLVGRPPLARLPVVAQQDVALGASGPLVLQIEGPIGTSAFAGLAVTLEDVARGRAIPIHPILFRARASGLRRARLSWKRFALDAPATLRLRVDGLDAARDHGDCAFVVARPVGLALPLAIVAVVASGVLLVASVVALALVANGVV